MATSNPVIVGTASLTGDIPEMRGASKAVRGSRGRFESRNWTSLQFGLPLSAKNDPQRLWLQEERRKRYLNKIQQQVGFAEFTGEGTKSNLRESTTTQMGQHFAIIPAAHSNILSSELKERQRLSDANIILQSIEAETARREAEAIFEKANERERAELALPVRRIDAGGITTARAEMAKLSHEAEVDELFLKTIHGAKSSARKKEEAGAVTKGIQDAFGKNALKSFAKFYGLKYGIGGAVQAVDFMIRNPLVQSKRAQEIAIAARMTGAEIQDVSGLGFASMMYGGGFGTASNFLGRINQLLQGALVGKGLGAFGDAALMYGLNITGSGKGGLATQEELIRNISEMMKRMDTRQKADFAQTLQMDKATFMLLKDGYVEYQKKMAYAREGDPYDKNADAMENVAESMGKVTMEWNKFLANLSALPGWQVILDATSSTLHSINETLTEETYIPSDEIKNSIKKEYEDYKNVEDEEFERKFLSVPYIPDDSYSENVSNDISSISPVVNINGNITMTDNAVSQIQTIVSDPYNWVSMDSIMKVS